MHQAPCKAVLKMTARMPGYSVGERARRLACDEIWNIGVLDQPIDDIARRGVACVPEWLPPPPPGTMLADPSCIAKAGGGFTLYAEQLDYHGNRRGEIWSADVACEADLATARFAPLIASPHHMSYPFPLPDADGGVLLTAETWGAGSALLWKVDGPVVELGAVMAGRQVVDPTLWRDDERWWLFCTFQDDSPNGALHLFEAADIRGPWRPHPGNPVQTGLARSRPAGGLFRMDGILVRPAQDCSASYGGAVVLQAVTCLDSERYEERPLRRIEPLPGAYRSGLHTICAAGRRTLIDGKRWRFDPLGLPSKLRQTLRRRLV